MESAILLDMVFGCVVIACGWVLKRIFFLIDRLQQEDKSIRLQMADLQSDSVSRRELQGALDRLLRSFESRMDKMEERLMSK